MKPTPPGWPRIAAALYYEDAAKAIDWLCKAFDFRVRIRVDGPGGSIEHAELEVADSLLMLSSADRKRAWCRSPKSVNGANTQNLMVYVDDADAHCAHARAAGAQVLMEPTTTDYGEDYWTDRGYECVDPEGHHWWFMQRLRTGKA